MDNRTRAPIVERTTGIAKQPRAWRRTALGLALAVISGILLTLAFPPYNLGLLIWLGFIPILVAQYHMLPDRHFYCIELPLALNPCQLER